VVEHLKTLATKFTKKDTNKHKNPDSIRVIRVHLRLILIRDIRAIRGKDFLVFRSCDHRKLSPYLRAGYGHAVYGHLFLWRIGRWNDVVCASIRRTINPDPAKNCVNNTSKALRKLKCCKSSETRSNMPITRLEMVSFTFRFKVKRHRNAQGNRNAKKR